MKYKNKLENAYNAFPRSAKERLSKIRIHVIGYKRELVEQFVNFNAEREQAHQPESLLDEWLSNAEAAYAEAENNRKNLEIIHTKFLDDLQVATSELYPHLAETEENDVPEENIHRELLDIRREAHDHMRLQRTDIGGRRRKGRSGSGV